MVDGPYCAIWYLPLQYSHCGICKWVTIADDSSLWLHYVLSLHRRLSTVTISSVVQLWHFCLLYSQHWAYWMQPMTAGSSQPFYVPCLSIGMSLLLYTAIFLWPTNLGCGVYLGVGMTLSTVPLSMCGSIRLTGQLQPVQWLYAQHILHFSIH